MASSWAEFCEQTNPGVLSEARGARPFQNAWRVQESISAAAEKRALVWMAERTPAWINSDHLTLLGFLAQILAGVGRAVPLEPILADGGDRISGAELARR